MSSELANAPYQYHGEHIIRRYAIPLVAWQRLESPNESCYG